MHLKIIKREIEKMSCKIHHEKPKVTIAKEVISYSVCCNEFGELIQSRMKDLHEIAVKETIKKMFP